MPKTYDAEGCMASKRVPEYIQYVRRVFTDLNEIMPLVKDGRGRRRGGANKTMITLPKHARHELYILHEIAHVIEGRVYGKYGHGKNFKIIFEGLISIYLPNKLKQYQSLMSKNTRII